MGSLSSGMPAPKRRGKKKETAQSRLAWMPYQRDDVHSNSQGRKVKRVPWQTPRFEDK